MALRYGMTLAAAALVGPMLPQLALTTDMRMAPAAQPRCTPQGSTTAPSTTLKAIASSEIDTAKKASDKAAPMNVESSNRDHIDQDAQTGIKKSTAPPRMTSAVPAPADSRCIRKAPVNPFIRVDGAARTTLV